MRRALGIISGLLRALRGLFGRAIEIISGVRSASGIISGMRRALGGISRMRRALGIISGFLECGEALGDIPKRGERWA